MRLGETAVYEMNLKQEELSFLLAPYDLIIDMDGGIRLEIGRFSLALLPRVQLLADPEPTCLLRVGAFCEIGTGAEIIVGGQHRNESLLNYTFGGQGKIFAAFMAPEAIPHASVARAAPIEIGDNVILSAGARVLGRAKIGSGTIVGASALVSDACDGCCIYAGVPARRLRDRFSPEMRTLYEAARLPDVMAHWLADLPLILHQLHSGEIALADYLAAVSFLPVRPTVHLSAALSTDSKVVVRAPTGYALGPEPVTQSDKVELLDAYFAQMKQPGRIRWTPDIFHTIGLY